ncbi:MAG TPA: 2-dehydropantoate 2-reductase [Planctomycetota bacterium]|nr:2-dehydropantoate 2-reductase [Planctomycetota bacterium]
MALSVAIVGPGALGRAVGGVLEKGGARVAYVGRGGRPERSRFENENENENERELVLVTVKAYDTRAAIRDAAPWLGRACVVSLQNGLGNVEAIAQVVGAARTFAGSTTHAARRTAGGEVVHVAEGETRIAPLDPAAFERARELAGRLSEHGLATSHGEYAQELLWRKLAISCGINAVTAIEGCPNGRLLEREDLHAEAVAATREALEVAAELGVAIDPPESADELVSAVCERTARNRSSMLQDVEAGRRTEIDEINGAVARIAREKLGREAPHNEALARRVKERSKTYA